MRACLFDKTGNGNNTDLGTLYTGYGSCAYSINNNGQIVGGSATNGVVGGRACIFDSTGSGANIDLGSLPNAEISYAYSINDSGQIVGTAIDSNFGPLWPNGLKKACLFNPTGGGNNTYIGPSGYNLGSEALSINNNGQIVGWATTTGVWEGRRQYACLFDSTGQGNNINLRPTTGDSNSIANSINNNGQIVGYVYEASGPLFVSPDAYLFTTGPDVYLGNGGKALNINDNGQIVGWAAPFLLRSNACLFDSTGGGNNIDLNTFIDPSSGWFLSEARCINNNGWIVGQGINPNGQTHAYLLIIPEPASIVLLAFGGLTILGRKKNKN